ncbi:MAG: sel1 repeat family protein [Verrucomicrobiota bacterium]|nr:sel1 repeat family protein [Verrucomicrobiota bacterium]
MTLTAIKRAYQAEGFTGSSLTAPLRAYAQWFKRQSEKADPVQLIALKICHVVSGFFAYPMLGIPTFLGVLLNLSCMSPDPKQYRHFFSSNKPCQTEKEFSDRLNHLFDAFTSQTHTVICEYDHFGIRPIRWYDGFTPSQKVLRTCKQWIDSNASFISPTVIKEYLSKWNGLPFLQGSTLQTQISNYIVLNTHQIVLNTHQIPILTDQLAEKTKLLEAMEPWLKVKELLECLEKGDEPSAAFEIPSTGGEKVKFHEHVLKLRVPFFNREGMEKMKNGALDDASGIRSFAIDSQLMPFATKEVLCQFRQYVYLRRLPEQFDPLQLYQWANFLQYKELQDQILLRHKPRDNDGAVVPLELYRFAAEQNNALGQAYLGWCYEHAIGNLPKDRAEAVRLYKLSAEQENAFGRACLGSCYQRGVGGLDHSVIKAVELFRLSANQGDSLGQALFGWCFSFGLGDLYQNKKRALELYQASAAQDDSLGQAYLGDCYACGAVGLSKSIEKAIEFYKSSVEQKNGYGLYQLGLCYEKGEGVLKNYERALELYKLSAEKENSQGQVQLGLCYERGRCGMPIDKTKAFHLYQRAAENEWARGQKFLGECYEEGIGTDPNPELALYWYTKASDNGSETANKRLQALVQ